MKNLLKGILQIKINGEVIYDVRNIEKEINKVESRRIANV